MLLRFCHVGIRALFQQQLRRGDVGRPRDDHQRCLAVRAGGIRIGAGIEQLLDHLPVRIERSFGERRGSQPIAHVRIRTSFQEARARSVSFRFAAHNRAVEPSASAAFTRRFLGEQIDRGERCPT